MNPSRFDGLNMVLADARCRRGVLGGVIALLAEIIGPRAGVAKRNPRKARHRRRHSKRRVTPSAKACRVAGHPCQGKQRCCPGLACTASGQGRARRCTPCASEGSTCVGDADCCGGACCRREGIDPVGVCCDSRDRCCGSACCTGELVCDFRFEMCVRCSTAGEFCQIPFFFCCPGLGLTCDVDAAQCVPET